MKIEAGKFYLTRHGKKAKVYDLVKTNGENCIHGAVLYDFGWGIHSWYDGGYFARSDSQPLDLIAEWVEPKPRLVAWLGDCDRVIMKPADWLPGPPLHTTNYVRLPHLDQPEAK